MKKKAKNHIKMIKSGCIDYYFPISIETNMSTLEVYDAVNKRITDIINKYNSNITAILKKDFENFESKENINNIHLKIEDNAKINSKNNDDLDPIKQTVTELKVEQYEKGIRFIPVIESDERIKFVENETIASCEFESKYYGLIYANSKIQIILPPYKIKLHDDSYNYIDSVLYIFENRMMVLRLSIPINNMDIDRLFDNDINGYLREVIDVYDLGYKHVDNDIVERIKDSYCKIICDSSKKIKSLNSYVKGLMHIILIDFDKYPENIHNMSEETIHDLYRISVAPIQEIDNELSVKQAVDYVEDNSDKSDGIKYVLSSMGRCVSLTDMNTIKYLEENNNLNKEDLLEVIKTSIRNNVEYTFMILLLKKTNYSFTYFQKEINTRNINKIQREFYNNSMFILKLQEFCYGSVREQLSFFENKMKYFLDNENTHEKMTAIDALIDDERNKKETEFQNLLSIGGIVLTVIFGLSAIRDTMEIIRKSNIFIRKDIPWITIDELSTILWIIFCVVLLIYVIYKNKRESRPKNIFKVRKNKNYTSHISGNN